MTEIQYFGDLDRAGLRIPASADWLAQTAGLPPMRPAVELYDALLTQGGVKSDSSQYPTTSTMN